MSGDQSTGKRADRRPWEKEPFVDTEAAKDRAIAAARPRGQAERRLAWEKEPFVDTETAKQRAIAAAQPPRTDTKSAAVAAYAQTAFDSEIERVRGTPEGERNGVLFKAAANLFELVAAGVLNETEVVDALRDACMANRSIQDDGAPQFERTVASARRKGMDNPRDLSNVGAKAGARLRGDDAEDEPTLLVLDDFRRLERGFWVERPSLQTIFLAAMGGMCAPWAVLAHCVAIALAQVRPHVTLPALGTKRATGGSLNWMALIVDDSGGGKDIARSVAEELVPIPDSIPVANVGSGEGLISAFVKPKTDDAPTGVHEAVTLECNEIDALTVVSSRSGSTMLTVLRSAFSGERLSFTYVKNANRPVLPKHSYRMTVTISAQPRQCAALLADAAGGTPQRFQWFPANDLRINSELPSWPGSLVLPSPSHWLYPTQMQVPYEAIELIRDERVRKVRGDKDALDSHALFVRLKFAVGLAVLDGRHTMNSDDWRLAGIAMRVSDHVRAYAAQQVELAGVLEAEKRGTVRGIEHDAASAEVTARVAKRQRRIADLIIAKLSDAGPTGVTQSDLKQSFASRDRSQIDAALEALERNGEIRRLDSQRGDRWGLV